MVRKRIVDSDTWTRATSIINSAHRQGLDPVEELHSHLLLLTPSVIAMIKGEALDLLLTRLYLTRPGEMMRRSPNAASTPAEMYHIIIDYIEELKTLIGKEGS